MPSSNDVRGPFLLTVAGSLPSSHRQITQPRSDYPEAGPLVAKIVKRVNAYIHAIDSTMLAAQIGYRLASEAMTLCDLMGEDDFIDEGRDNLDTMKALADEGYENAEKTNVAFREIRQELYKVLLVLSPFCIMG